MSKRIAVSKRARFDVFKRDGFACQYCGATPPGALLECDHIQPVALGGLSDAGNLVTACQACNRGKGAAPLSDVPISLMDRAAEVAEREAQIAGYEKIMRARRERVTKQALRIELEFHHLFKYKFTDPGLLSIKRFIEKLGYDEVFDAVEISSARCGDDALRAWKYMCGVCWSKIKNRASV